MARSAGTLDRFITIERNFPESSDDFNEPVDNWQTYAQVWAHRRDVSDGERFAAGQVDSFLRTRFIIRASCDTEDVTPHDRILYEGSPWNIIGIKEGEQGFLRGRWLEITAIKDND